MSTVDIGNLRRKKAPESSDARSRSCCNIAICSCRIIRRTGEARLPERLGKDEVPGSNPGISSIKSPSHIDGEGDFSFVTLIERPFSRKKSPVQVRSISSIKSSDINAEGDFSFVMLIDRPFSRKKSPVRIRGSAPSFADRKNRAESGPPGMKSTWFSWTTAACRRNPAQRSAGFMDAL